MPHGSVPYARANAVVSIGNLTNSNQVEPSDIDDSPGENSPTLLNKSNTNTINLKKTSTNDIDAIASKSKSYASEETAGVNDLEEISRHCLFAALTLQKDHGDFALKMAMDFIGNCKEGDTNSALCASKCCFLNVSHENRETIFKIAKLVIDSSYQFNFTETTLAQAWVVLANNSYWNRENEISLVFLDKAESILNKFKPTDKDDELMVFVVKKNLLLGRVCAHHFIGNSAEENAYHTELRKLSKEMEDFCAH